MPIKSSKNYSPDVVKAYKAAIIAMKKGQNSDAQSLFQAILRKEPAMLGAHMNTGILLRQAGEFDASKQAFLKVIELDSKNAMAYNELGVLARNKGEFDQAEKMYKKAVKLDANYHAPLLNLGILYDLYLLKPKDALNYYKSYQVAAKKPEKNLTIWIKDLEKRIEQARKTNENTQRN